MKLKYYCHSELFKDSYATPFKILKDSFEISFDDSCDIIPIDFSSFYDVITRLGFEADKAKVLEVINKKISLVKTFYSNQTIVLMAITCADDRIEWQKLFDYVYQEFKKEFSTVFLVHPFRNILNYTYQNVYLNYTKAYYTEFESLNLHDTNDGSYTTEKNFVVNNIGVRDSATSKVFLCANRILYDSNGSPIVHGNIKMIARLKLLDFLRGQDGFLSDFENDVILPGQTPNSTEYLHRVRGNGTWIPVHTELYDTSYISIFVETTVSENQKLITEKTYDPLIKGHFILPFGYPGLICDLKDMGFKFPDWIDYSYDEIPKTNLRFSKFRSEIERLLNLGKTVIDGYHIKDIPLLKYNQQLFFKKSYEEIKLL